MFRFADPWLLALLLLVPALVLFRRLVVHGGRAVFRYSAVSAVRVAGGAARPWVRVLPDAMRVLALSAAVIAFARPQTGVVSEEVKTEGIDIVLVIDISTSMLARDLTPNRLEAAKAVAVDFVAGRSNDRLGLVAFAGQAFTQAPLTLDAGIVTTLVGELETGMVEDGTAVGMGLATAVKRLEGSPAASKVVILLTDGRNNSGEIGPSTAGRIAQALAVRVYTIGVGTTGPVQIPISPASQMGPQTVMAEFDIDEESLQEIAELTGGRYFRATDEESLAAIYAEIDELERTEISVTEYTTYQERFQLPLLAAFLIFVTEIALRRTLLRRLP